MSVADRSMGLGLRALGRFAGSDLVDRLGLRRQAEGVVYRATRDGFKAAGAAGRGFRQVQRNGNGGAARLKPAGSGRFDLSPTDEQRMLQESFRAFGAELLRPAALQADEAAQASQELLDHAAELGLTMLGVPEELGGAVSERSTVTAVLAAEALAHGDMGLAAAALAPAGVATALSLWRRRPAATFLPALLDDAPVAAALALQEPRPLFDPFQLRTTARIDGADYVLSGVKSFVLRATDAELLLVAADIAGHGPGLFLVEAGADGVLAKPAPAMGVRAAAAGELLLQDVRLPARALLGDGSPAVYAECVRRARLAWCALAIGTGGAVLDYVIPYVNERVAFGEPISHRQSVAFAVSNIAIELEGMRLATLRAASRADMGKSCAREVALARQLCSEKGAWIGSEGLQLLGGHGYIKEHPVERWYRDLRAVGLAEGALLV